MDPNAALANLRTAVADFRAAANTSVAEDPVDEAAHGLADAAEALDGWLSGGGFLPEAWKPAEPDHTGDLLAAVLSAVIEEDKAERLPAEPVLVTFAATEHDNGYFFDSTGLVYFADPAIDPVDIDFDSVVEGHLTEIASCYAVGSSAALTVDLRGGEVSFEDYMDHADALAVAARIAKES